jgi:hypothetical protein
MHVLFVAVIVLGALVGCGSGNSSTTRTMTGEERAAADERRAAAWQEELAERQAAIERTAPAAERAATAPSSPAPAQPSLLERMMDADGKGMCNIRLQDTARAITAQSGTLHRWTTRYLDERFPEKSPTADPDVTTYYGNAIEFMEDDGSWLRMAYGCDYDHDAGEIVRVRTAEW